MKTVKYSSHMQAVILGARPSWALGSEGRNVGHENSFEAQSLVL